MPHAQQICNILPDDSQNPMLQWHSLVDKWEMLLPSIREKTQYQRYFLDLKGLGIPPIFFALNLLVASVRKINIALPYGT